MKRTFIAILAAAAVLAACNKMEEIDNNTGHQNAVDVELSDGQILCAIPQTKTALDENLNVIWSESDEIMVLGGDRQAAKYEFNSYASEDSKTAAVFENVDPKVTGTRAAIYPASAYVADSYNGTTAKIELGGVNAVNIPTGTHAEVLGNTVVSTLPLVSTPSEETLSFSNLFGGIMFCPYDYMGMGVKIQKISIASTDGKALAGVATVDLATGTMTKFEGTETELTFKYGDTDITSEKGFIAYVPAGEYEGLVITPIDNMGRKFPVTTGAITVNAGKVKQLPELPLTIWYGTTNCYIVEPGTTSIEIDATPYYTYSGDYDVTKGNVIRVQNGNMSGLGADVSVLWQQKEGDTATDLTGTASASKVAEGDVVNGELKIDRKFQEGKAIITVPLTGEKGNAVIALWSVNNANAREKIVWSFHIWVSEVNDVACSTSAGSYSILDRNIGATSIDGSLNSFGVNYQWGRKDPFPRDFNTQSGTSANGDLLKMAERASSTTVAYSITNPDTRVTYTQNNASGAKWLPISLNGLWGYDGVHGDSGKAKEVKSTVKTVYDPCPEGYKVPALVYLTSIGDKNTKAAAVSGKGYNMSTGSSTTFFPYGGYVRVSKTERANDYQLYRGYIWTAINRSDSQGAYIFRYNADGIQQNKNSIGANIYTYCGDALPVRCIKE